MFGHNKLWTIIVMIVVFVFLYDIVIRRNWRRFTRYNAAKETAKRKNKKLLVIGATDTGGISGQISSQLHLYGCGDVCIDMEGCRACEKSIKGRIEDILPTLDTDSFVIYVSVVLEYVDDLEFVIKELERVSGGDLYVVYIDNIIDGPFDSYFDYKSKKTYKGNWRIVSGPPYWKYQRII